jgi:hypothetical protein
MVSEWVWIPAENFWFFAVFGGLPGVRWLGWKPWMSPEKLLGELLGLGLS